MSDTIVLARQRDPRLASYVTLATAGVVITLVTGSAAIGALTAMFVVVIVYGLRRSGDVDVATNVEVHSPQLIEGDRAAFTILVRHDPAYELSIVAEVPNHVHERLTVVHTQRGMGFTELHLEREFPNFGNQRIGRLTATASSPASLIRWQGEIADLGDIRVLPRPDRLSELLAPHASQVSAGIHPSRTGTGDGTDFAEVRDYQRGDRLRDINWKVTARRGSPHVTRRIPERGGDVVIVLDGLRSEFVDRTDFEFQLVKRAGQAAWALIRQHMGSQDRVGLVVGSTQRQIFLPPRGGVRAQYALAEALLELTSDRAFLSDRSLDQTLIPPGALTLALSPLLRLDSTVPIVKLATSGRTVGALAISASDLLVPTSPQADAVGQLISQSFDAQVAFLRRTNIPTVVWSPKHDIDRAVRQLGRLTGRRTRRGVA